MQDVGFSQEFELREDLFQKLRERLEAAPLSLSIPLAAFVPDGDEFQRAVIDSQHKTIRVLAPAGSGKTKTVINRVLRLASSGLNPERILVLTFDRAAASSLNETLRQAREALSLPELRARITTLNAFGYDVLRRFVPEEFRPVVTPQRQSTLMKEILRSLEEKSPERFGLLPKSVRRRVYTEFMSILKNSLFDPRSFDPQALADFLLTSRSATLFLEQGTTQKSARLIVEALIWMFRAYDALLARDRLLDFDDQKLRTYVAASTSAELRRRLQTQFSEIIVDEFQDINPLDFALIKLIAADATLVVTGDDDQAIYGFRGCSPEYIIDLERHLGRPVALFELRTNYRCPENIVAHADRLIRHNTMRVPKAPIAFRKDVATIQVVQTHSAGLEARFMAENIRHCRAANPKLSWSDFAILYRTNAQSFPLQIELLLAGIPFSVREEDSILKNEVLERLLGVLRLVEDLRERKNPVARDAVLLVQGYFQYVPKNALGPLRGLFEKTPFWTALGSPEFFRALPKAETSSIVERVNDLLAAKSLTDLLGRLGKFRGMQGMIGSLEDMLDERMPLGEIFDLALDFRGSTREFVALLEGALTRAREAKNAERAEGEVSLLTYFRAKGRQWHTVMLTTCNQGIIPHRRSDLEEERRLMYVALTRASGNLVVSYVKKSCNAEVQASQFLFEAGLMES